MDKIEKKILRLQQSGYEVRFPGGTGKSFSKKSSHASFGIIPRVVGMAIEILVVPYRNIRGDGNEDFSGSFAEKPEQTLRREIQEETGVIVIGCDFIEEKQSKDNHTKYSFFVNEFDDSNLRTKVSPYQQEIGVPFWCPIELLEKNISHSHQWILENAMRHHIRMWKPFIGYTMNVPKKEIILPIEGKPSAVACL